MPKPFHDNSYEHNREREPPSLTSKNAKKIAETVGYKIHADPLEHRVYIETTDYHPGTLVVEKQGLAQLIKEAFAEEERSIFLKSLI